MNHDLRFGVIAPIGKAQWGAGTDPRELIDFGVRVERLGFDSLWGNDSLLTPRVDPLTYLSAVASRTERVTLGTAALMPVLRRPVQTAQALTSLDLLSGGRLTVGVGAGFPGRLGRPLYTLSEVPWERRFARLDETVALWRQLWTAEAPSSFHGEFLRFDQIPAMAAPAQKGGPPIWLGGATPAALARTGRLYDGWIPYPPEPSTYAAGLAEVRRAAGDRAVTPALFLSVLVDGGGRAAMDDFARANYGMPLVELEKIQAVVTGDAGEVAARLAAYAAAGARHFVMRLGALDLAGQRAQLDRLAEVASRAISIYR
ncbi:LLM class flavin-dependent oxidoreductase [Actinomadura parmotrematis]|uniref:LLM class flavin-dependent oxidoreductase n=1 Tax=Actinomadura parmotrematis TaxID=2864039 RepID=A0ABS7G3N8_9ACTN|nr:LLM class flavin-dependent oxidoreductase [Actinomadura parmotrematis]MBW8487327.1 LLM class flavin-dependent oxidoreductase [Actinomadura parmotrematis]